MVSNVCICLYNVFVPDSKASLIILLGFIQTPPMADYLVMELGQTQNYIDNISKTKCRFLWGGVISCVPPGGRILDTWDKQTEPRKNICSSHLSHMLIAYIPLYTFENAHPQESRKKQWQHPMIQNLFLGKRPDLNLGLWGFSRT